MSDNDDDFMCEDEEDYGLVSVLLRRRAHFRDSICLPFEVMMWKNVACRKYLFLINHRPVVYWSIVIALQIANFILILWWSNV